ncbi:IS3 family transposase [Sporosarcina sp. D27]|uniref:IS3 family transposase n=1 Tax=Sporosarcina sp. D27 TaxID=1382305 RepID=UPI0009DD7425
MHDCSSHLFHYARIESVHAILRKEEVYQTTNIDFETLRFALFHYIESWYNRKRIHIGQSII